MANAFDFRPYERHVQQGLPDGAYASGAFTLIAAGPPRLLQTPIGALGGEALTYPIGMVQNFSLSHNRQFSRVFELGSERSYFVSGRTVGQIQLGRVMYHGPSILRALYAGFQSQPANGVTVPAFNSLQKMADAYSSSINQHDVKIRPGFNNLYLNLASDMFSQPIGLLIKTLDSNEKTIGAVYAEGCYIPNHSFSTDSQGLLVQEQVSIQFERIVPVRTEMLSLKDSLVETASQALFSTTSGEA